MEHAVKVRVSGEPAAAHAAAEALTREIARHPRAGAKLTVDEAPGDALALQIALRADTPLPAWLPPVPLPAAPEAAAAEAIAFLERWGFIAVKHAHC